MGHHRQPGKRRFGIWQDWLVSGLILIGGILCGWGAGFAFVNVVPWLGVDASDWIPWVGHGQHHLRPPRRVRRRPRRRTLLVPAPLLRYRSRSLNNPGRGSPAMTTTCPGTQSRAPRAEPPPLSRNPNRIWARGGAVLERPAEGTAASAAPETATPPVDQCRAALSLALTPELVPGLAATPAPTPVGTLTPTPTPTPAQPPARPCNGLVVVPGLRRQAHKPPPAGPYYIPRRQRRRVAGGNGNPGSVRLYHHYRPLAPPAAAPRRCWPPARRTPAAG